jgi:Raf kinase inhibitor-like YbhB/YbcL family protein
MAASIKSTIAPSSIDVFEGEAAFDVASLELRCVPLRRGSFPAWSRLLEVAMGVMHDAARALGNAGSGLRAGPEKLASRKLGLREPATLEVTSPDLEPGQPLPGRAVASREGAHEQLIQGDGEPPRLRWSRVPDGARAFSVVCEDEDAPLPEPFVHWLVYGIPASTTSLDATSLRSVREGKNSTLKTGFAPAAPPPGHGVHHYHFQVFALDADIDLSPGVGRGDLFEAIRGHVLAWGDLVGTYER